MSSQRCNGCDISKRFVATDYPLCAACMSGILDEYAAHFDHYTNGATRKLAEDAGNGGGLVWVEVSHCEDGRAEFMGFLPRNAIYELFAARCLAPQKGTERE